MRSLLVVAVLIAGCGYTVGTVRLPGNVRAVSVTPVIDDGIDVDAASLIDIAVRRAVARHPSTELVARKRCQGELKVELLKVRGGLAPLANPGRRAAQYRASVRIKATLSRKDGQVLWASPAIVGQADYLSVPDGIETLDGARRRSLQRAAAHAADQLMTMLVYRRP